MLFLRRFEDPGPPPPTGVQKQGESLLGQHAHGGLGLDDAFVGELLLQVAPCQAPEVIHLVDGPFRQVVLLVI